MIALSPGNGSREVLCLGAHPDDIEIGCGGSLLRLAGRPGVRVRGVVLTTDGERAREARDALQCLIFAPRVDDAHQDHRLVGKVTTTVWRDSLVLHYEVPKWDGDLSAPTHYVGLTGEEAHLKVSLLNESLPSQVRRNWWDDELFLGLMRIRGVESRQPYAEGDHASKVLVNLVGTLEGRAG